MLLPHIIVVETATTEAVPGGSVIGKQWVLPPVTMEGYVEPVPYEESPVDIKGGFVSRPHYLYAETTNKAVFRVGSRVTKDGTRFFTVKNLPLELEAASDLDYIRILLQENQFGE